MFSVRLPKSQQRTERILVDADDLLDPLPLTFSKSFPYLKQFTSLPNLLESQEKTEDSVAHTCSLDRFDDFDSSWTSKFEDNSINNTEEEEDMASPESCQTALVAGGLVRAVLQNTFPPATRLPLRIRQLKERLATMSDTDWVVKYQKPSTNESSGLTNDNTQFSRFGLTNVSSFSTLLEAGHRQNNNNVVDPLLSPFETNTGSTPSSPSLPTKQQLSLVGVENFFHTGSVTSEQTPIQQQKGGGMGRLNRLASKNLIISPLIPKEKRKGILMSQQNRCFGCGIYVETKYLRSMRFCEYFGRFFCSMCHSNTLMALPGALVQTWSGAMYPVSKFARDLLTPLHNLPLLHSADFGPNLRQKPPWTLLDAIQLRKQALAIVPFLKLCHDSAEALTPINKLPSHWITSANNWSMSDLVCLANTPNAPRSLIVRLRADLEICVEHIYQCARCRVRGHLCEVCHSGRVLFPNFGQVDTRVCSDCGACFHRACLTKLPFEGGPTKGRDFHPDHRSCPRCARIRQRSEQNDGSPLDSSL
ncbi:unnamed protein product [Hymenolepis diminuta]|nr:unnamed protein product [Hymenolepis diminuta]